MYERAIGIAVQTTPLALDSVNDAIADAKSQLEGDRYADRVKQFVAAGESPQYSDVVLVLGTLKPAVERLERVWFKTGEHWACA
jgi:hypothetical protein